MKYLNDRFIWVINEHIIFYLDIREWDTLFYLSNSLIKINLIYESRQ